MPETKKVLLSKVLDIAPYLSIVILTDQSLSQVDKEGKLLKIQYLIKPIAPERLLDCVGMILNQEENLNKRVYPHLSR